MDRQLLIIIIFLGITFSLAGVLVMGAVPKIFETKETAEETKSETVNQTEIILKQFSRENNTTHKIISNQGVVIDKLNQSLENQNVMLKQQSILLIGLNDTIQHNANDIALNLEIAKQHEQVARDHDMIANFTQNTTKHIDDALYEYGENSVKQLQGILDNQQKIFKILNSTSSK